MERIKIWFEPIIFEPLITEYTNHDGRSVDDVGNNDGGSKDNVGNNKQADVWGNLDPP